MKLKQIINNLADYVLEHSYIEVEVKKHINGRPVIVSTMEIDSKFYNDIINPYISKVLEYAERNDIVESKYVTSILGLSSDHFRQTLVNKHNLVIPVSERKGTRSKFNVKQYLAEDIGKLYCFLAFYKVFRIVECGYYSKSLVLPKKHHYLLPNFFIMVRERKLDFGKPINDFLQKLESEVLKNG